MEKYTSNVRFAILCNYQSHIIPALQSRCTRFRFAPLAPEIMIARLQQIAEQEQYQFELIIDSSKIYATWSSRFLNLSLCSFQSQS